MRKILLRGISSTQHNTTASDDNKQSLVTRSQLIQQRTLCLLICDWRRLAAVTSPLARRQRVHAAWFQLGSQRACMVSKNLAGRRRTRVGRLANAGHGLC